MLALVISGAVAWWALAFVRIIRFNRLMKEIAPAPEEWQRRTAELAGRLGLARAPSLSLVPGRVPPMLWAIGSRPRLLVPSELWSTTSPDERTSLLLHERWQLEATWTIGALAQWIVGGLYWWHPAVWWGRRLLREAEEQCCDAWVIWAMPKGAKTYATALLTAIEFVSGARTAPAASSATSGNGHVSCLKRRLKMIVRAQTPKGLSWAGRLAVVAAAMFLLPLAPSWGQKSDTDEPAAELNSVADFDEYNVPSAEPIQTADQSSKLVARLSQDDAKKDEPAREDKGRETAERFEEHVKTLIETLKKELGPVGEELRKILEKSIDEIHETLKKEGVAPEELRKALEKSHNEMRKGLEKGGTVNKELREAFEKSRRDLQEEWERTRGDLRTAMRDRVQPRRQQERAAEAQKDVDQADSAKKEAAELEEERAELEKVRSEVRTLEQQLRQANRRLIEMQRRTLQRRGGPGGRRGDVPGRVGPRPRTGRAAFRAFGHSEESACAGDAGCSTSPRAELNHRPLSESLSHLGDHKSSESEGVTQARNPNTKNGCGTSTTSLKNCSRRSRSSKRKRSRRNPRTRPRVELGPPAQAHRSSSEVNVFRAEPESLPLLGKRLRSPAPNWIESALGFPGYHVLAVLLDVFGKRFDHIRMPIGQVQPLARIMHQMKQERRVVDPRLLLSGGRVNRLEMELPRPATHGEELGAVVIKEIIARAWAGASQYGCE